MSVHDKGSYQSGTLSGSYSWIDTLKGVYYGPGSVRTALPKLLDQLGGKKALIVTGKSLYQKTDVVRAVEAILQKEDAYSNTFCEIGAHAPIAGIRAGAKAFKDAGADVIVSIGGGSPIDASKAIIYQLQQESGGEFVKQIAIPTTLSAAEYTIGAGYTSEQGVKVGYGHHQLAPSGIILDAELTLATPEWLWLSTGIRALDHAVESLYRPIVPPPIKILCYSAIADLFKYLPISKADPKDIMARQKLQLASWQSLWPLKLERTSALGLSHSLGHKLGAAYGIPHGVTSCITLAPVVALMSNVASEEDKQWLADALFYLRIQPSGAGLESDILLLSSAIDRLVKRLGLESTLTQYNVPKDDIPDIAGKALAAIEGSGRLGYEAVIQLLENKY